MFQLARDVQESWQKERGQFAFCGDCKLSLHIHSCEVDGDCTTGEHYSI